MYFNDLKDSRAYRHTLIVGGTGMLAGATRYLRVHSRRITLVLRNATLAAECFGLSRGDTLDLNWTTPVTFDGRLSEIIEQDPPDAALLWVHRGGIHWIDWLIPTLLMRGAVVVHVLGSAQNRWSIIIEDPEFTQSVSCGRYVVTLGSVRTGVNSYRWLTHDEIADGVISSVEARKATRVGTLLGDV